jgi:hypothetical protein
MDRAIHIILISISAFDGTLSRELIYIQLIEVDFILFFTHEFLSFLTLLLLFYLLLELLVIKLFVGSLPSLS